MSEFSQFLDACIKANGNPVSLRSVFPGRGRSVRKLRDVIRAKFNNPETETFGVRFDSARGVFALEK